MSFGGSPKYRAPEVLLKKTHEPSIDYYALGEIAYICLMRRHFVPESEAEMRDMLRAGRW